MAVDDAKTFESFGLTHAAFLAREDDPAPNTAEPGCMHTMGDVYGVRNASIAADTGNFDNTGDDFTLSSWFWINFATVTVEAGFVPFELVAMLQGDEVTTSDIGDGDSCYSVPLYSECATNTPPRPMLARAPAKDIDGALRTIDFYLFKVFVGVINFTGPAYRAGLAASWTGKAVLSNKDEKGNTLERKAIGRLASCPSSCPVAAGACEGG